MSTEGELLTFCLPIDLESRRGELSLPTVVLLSELGEHMPRNVALAERLTPVDVDPGENSADGSGLVQLMHQYARKHGCSLSVALSEITKRDPGLWKEHSEAVMKEAPGERLVIPIE